MHAAAHAGFAQISEVPHNDLDAIEGAIRDWRSSGGIGHVWIAVESLYGMDGDQAPLQDLASLSDRRDAFLFIDDAHATGVYGLNGRGLAHDLEGRENVVVLHACGKALGCSGALVTAPNVLCEFLVNRCRPFIYATAPSPLIAVAVTEALAIIRDEPQRRDKLMELVEFANGQIQKRFGFEPSGSQIIPLHIGDNSRAVAIAAILRARGYDLRGVLPPSVPDGKAHLRISLTLNVSQVQVSNMVDALFEELENDCA
jgi:8-amino-7-oxononanoate synthase